jgi:hypothetical protein
MQWLSGGLAGQVVAGSQHSHLYACNPRQCQWDPTVDCVPVFVLQSLLLSIPRMQSQLPGLLEVGPLVDTCSLQCVAPRHLLVSGSACQCLGDLVSDAAASGVVHE